MKAEALVIPVTVSAKIFSRFALFDAFRIKKRWKSPAFFAAMMLVFALVSFSRLGQANGAALLGTVFLIVGLGLPATYFASFFLSIQRQIKRMGLKDPKQVYTLTFSQEESKIHVETKNGEEADYQWEETFGLYKGKDCLYLYVAQARAYLLPCNNLGQGGEETLWKMAQQYGKTKKSARGK